MKYLLLFFISANSFACGSSVAKKDIDLLRTNKPPLYAISINCKEDCDCLDSVNGGDVSVAGLEYVDRNPDGSLTVNAAKKATHDTDIENKIAARIIQFDAIKKAEIEKIVDDKLQATTKVGK